MWLRSFCVRRRGLGRGYIADGAQGDSEDPIVLARGSSDEGAGAGDDFAGIAPVGDEGDAGETELFAAFEEGEFRGGDGDAGDAFGGDGDVG